MRQRDAQVRGRVRACLTGGGGERLCGRVGPKDAKKEREQARQRKARINDKVGGRGGGGNAEASKCVGKDASKCIGKGNMPVSF